MLQALTLTGPVRGLKLGAADVKSRAVGLWRAYPRETLGFGLLALAAGAAIGGAANSMPEPTAATDQTQRPPPPPPLLVRQLAPEQIGRAHV